jgi:DNA polymerase-3 subunit alpha
MTLGTIGAKAALKDANRVLGGPYKDGERLVGLLPPATRGREPTLDDIRHVPESDVPTVDLARGLEGLIRQPGIHAAAVIISPVPLEDVLPVWKPVGGDVLVTGYTAEPVEKLGLVKTDLLGLRNLDVIDECLRHLPDVEIPPTHDDPQTYATLASGHTKGVFQLDGGTARRILRDIKPKTLYDVAVAVALNRPGSLDNGTDKEYARRRKNQTSTS